MKTMCKSAWIISPSWAKRQNDWNHHLVLDWYGKSLWKFWESHISIMFLPYANTTSSTDVKLKTHQKLEDDDRWANAGITGLENQRGNRRLAVDNWETCWGWRHLTWNRFKGFPSKERKMMSTRNQTSRVSLCFIIHSNHSWGTSNVSDPEWMIDVQAPNTLKSLQKT